MKTTTFTALPAPKTYVNISYNDYYHYCTFATGMLVSHVKDGEKVKDISRS